MRKEEYSLMPNRPVRLLIAGAGSRGAGYARYAEQHPDRARVVAVAEPRDAARERLARAHGIPAANVFRDWREAAARPRLADAALICTQDADHADPAVAFAGLGYHLLLEKPMAPSEADCRRIVRAVEEHGVLFAVCHVMRYTAHTRKIKELLDNGLIGDLISVQHTEGVGYWHQAHSFVRGNWRNSRESSFMLLAKSCHDLDWLRYMMQGPCRCVSSFGSLRHFRPDQAPAGAAARCLDCAVEPTCPYSALKLYLGNLRRGNKDWPLSVLTDDLTEAGVRQALREGPYGRCVYACDNDVVDHQVVNLEFDGGRTACFTMTAFTGRVGRATRFFGTRGELACEDRMLTHIDFLTDKTTTYDTQVGDPSLLGGHGGGDAGLMDCFIAAVAAGDQGLILSGPRETLESHLIVFAAEQARLENRVVDVRL